MSLLDEWGKKIINWEGGLSNDRRDSASKCIAYPKYHTNRGVTYCTFKTLAKSLGLPVTYEKFVTLTPKEAKKFIYRFSPLFGAGKFKNAILELILVEFSWGSGWLGNLNFYNTLRKNYGYKGSYTRGKNIINDELVKASVKAYNQNKKKFIDNIINERFIFLKSLKSAPTYLKGWTNRLNDFGNFLYKKLNLGVWQNINYKSGTKNGQSPIRSTNKKNNFRSKLILPTLAIIGVYLLVTKR